MSKNEDYGGNYEYFESMKEHKKNVEKEHKQRLCNRVNETLYIQADQQKLAADNNILNEPTEFMNQKLRARKLLKDIKRNDDHAFESHSLMHDIHAVVGNNNISYHTANENEPAPFEGFGNNVAPFEKAFIGFPTDMPSIKLVAPVAPAPQKTMYQRLLDCVGMFSCLPFGFGSSISPTESEKGDVKIESETDDVKIEKFLASLSDQNMKNKIALNIKWIKHCDTHCIFKNTNGEKAIDTQIRGCIFENKNKDKNGEQSDTKIQGFIIEN